MARGFILGAWALTVILAGDRLQAANGEAAEPRHEEKLGGFSYIPPKGWEIRKIPGFKYRFAVGPTAQGFAPNLSVTDSLYDGSLTDFVDANIETMRKSFKRFQLIKRELFKTSAGGPPGVRVVVQNLDEDLLLRQVFYFIADGQKKFIMTGAALAMRDETLDPIFDASAASFRLEGE